MLGNQFIRHAHVPEIMNHAGMPLGTEVLVLRIEGPQSPVKASGISVLMTGECRWAGMALMGAARPTAQDPRGRRRARHSGPRHRSGQMIRRLRQSWREDAWKTAKILILARLWCGRKP